MDKALVTHRIPTVQEYLELRKTVGWKIMNFETALQILSGSVYSVCIEYNSEIIAMGRLIGDGGAAFYLHDIIVKPKFQKMGMGKLVMENIIKYIKKNCITEKMVYVVSNINVEGFYKKFGFKLISKNDLGSHMELLL